MEGLKDAPIGVKINIVPVEDKRDELEYFQDEIKKVKMGHDLASTKIVPTNLESFAQVLPFRT